MLKHTSARSGLFLIWAAIIPCYCQWASNINNHDAADHALNKTEGQGKKPQGPVQPFPYALSSTYLTYLARTEQELYKDINNYATILRERLQIAETYIKDYEDSTVKGTEHLDEKADAWQKATQVATNPLLSYRMVRRFATEFRKLGSHVNQNIEPKLVARINKLGGGYGFPSDRDHNDAMDALLRLHYMYGLKPSELAKGKIQEVETRAGLTADQCYKISEFAVNNEFYTLAQEWLKVTETKIKQDNDTSVSAISLANTYKLLVEKHDRNFENNRNKGHLYMYTDRLTSNPEAPTLKDVSMEKYRVETSDRGQGYAGHYNFISLCNGEDFQSLKEKSKLYCWLETKKHPYFTIFPLKMELLSKEPYVVQIYDIVNDAWIKDMTRAALPTLQRAPPPNAPGTTIRTATYAWLEDEHIPDTPIARRIELMFDLKVRGLNASEALQIASYAFGGHVNLHYDSLAAWKKVDDPLITWKGDRISTFLVYLNDVQKGGLTAFPAIGTSVKPIKGSAVYWHTSLRNGQVDRRMIHGACPIVYGHKWIATKWTHLNENFLKWPCSLDPNK